MPDFDAASVPRKEVTIAGLRVQAPLPYTPGHVLTEGEAAALNQVYIENVRNSMAAQMTKAKEELQAGTTFDLAAWEPKIQEYFQNYQFGTRNSTTSVKATMDPVEREALSMARSTIAAAIKQQGYSLKAVGEEKIMELAKQLLEKNPAFREQAKQVVESRRAVGKLSLDSFNFGEVAPAPASAEAPAAE